MSAEVGGELEAVPTRRSLFGPDYGRLAILVLTAIAIHAWLIANTAIPARDSLGYARIAVKFSDPNAGETNPHESHQRIDVIRSAEQPPGYPMAIWLTEKVLRCVTSGLSVADRSLLATQIANATAAVLLVIPMYLIGRILFGRNIGFAGAFLFQVLPVPARVTSDGLSEGLYLLAASVAIMLGVRAGRRPGIGGFVLCGLATGACYLVRPEGLLVGVAVGLVIAAAGITRSWPRDVALGRLTALCVGVAMVALPYMVLIGKLTNKTSPSVILQAWDTPPPPIWKGQPGARAPGGATPLFAAWWDPKVDEGKNRVVWAIGAVWGEMIKALHYVVGSLMLIAIFAHRRRLFVPDWGLWVMIVLCLLTLTMLVYLAARVGYISERHTVLLVMLCSIFAPASCRPLADVLHYTPLINRLIFWPKAVPGLLYCILIVWTVPYALKPMHPHREGHKHAGRWLADHMSEKDWLQDPLAWAEWYAGRTVYKTATYDGQPEYIWVVIEKGKGSPHSRLPQWDEAKRRATEAGAKPAYRWPENAPPEGPAVEVYKVKYQATP
ncbi:MAG: glycosyltransferase family 39 protein [Planctomycetes bacterium]|nr:glycosyltransferase family 39 protein [Planctomycetota bacterium]